MNHGRGAWQVCKITRFLISLYTADVAALACGHEVRAHRRLPTERKGWIIRKLAHGFLAPFCDVFSKVRFRTEKE